MARSGLVHCHPGVSFLCSLQDMKRYSLWRRPPLSSQQICTEWERGTDPADLSHLHDQPVEDLCFDTWCVIPSARSIKTIWKHLKVNIYIHNKTMFCRCSFLWFLSNIMDKFCVITVDELGNWCKGEIWYQVWHIFRQRQGFLWSGYSKGTTLEWVSPWQGTTLDCVCVCVCVCVYV